MKAHAPDPNADLRQQLRDGRAARTAAVERLKDVSEKAAGGKRTPITDKFTLPDPESADSSDDLTPIARVNRCTAKVVASGKKRSNGVRALKQTTLAVVQIVRQTTYPDGVNGNGHGGPAAEPT